MIKTKIIAVPVDRIKAVEEFLGKKIGENQVPIIKIRVNEKKVRAIRKIIKGD